MIAKNNSGIHQLIALGLLSIFGLTACSTTPTDSAGSNEPAAEPSLQAETMPAEPMSMPEPEPEMPMHAEAPVESSSSAVTINSDIPDIYIVKKGDTLWDISSHFLKDPWLWPQVWYNNPNIENPHLIFPGDRIALVYIDGKPRILVNPDSIPRYDPPPRTDLPVVKLSPTARSNSLERAITTIPKKVVAPFLTRPYILEEDDLDGGPYIVSSYEEHLMTSEGDKIYVNNLEHTTLTQFNIVRPGKVYIDPDTEKVLGYEAENLGKARLIKVGTPSTLIVTLANREIINGDFLIPIEKEDYNLNFFPRAPTKEVKGRIVSVVDGVRKFGQYQVVVINHGTDSGLEPGHVLEIYQAGPTVRDPHFRDEVTLPKERAGILMVFKPYKTVSYALVMEAYVDLSIYDYVASP